MKPDSLRRSSIAASAAMAAALALGVPTAATAQGTDFPNRPVKLMVATAAGGNSDALARAIAEKLTAAWGQQVLVENRVGANGMIATQALIRSPADGYTAYLSISNMVQNVLLRKTPGYRMEDLAPVSMVAIYPIAFAASAKTSITTVPELLALARQKPGTVNFGSYGVGSGAHVIGAAISHEAGVQMTHVAYKGEAASFTDLVSGQLMTNFGSVGFYANQLSTGTVRLLAVASPHRLKRFPDVPTLAEAGFPAANLPGWAGIFLPAGTPAAVTNKFTEAVRKVVAMPDIQARIYDFGFEPVGGNAEEFKKHIDDEIVKWSKAINDSNISID